MSLEGMINRYDALKYEKFMMDMQTGTIRRAVLSCVIEGAPTIEAEPVVHARWAWNGFDGAGWECSHCEQEINKRTQKPTEKYCQNCGAKMDAKEADNAEETDIS